MPATTTTPVIYHARYFPASTNRVQFGPERTPSPDSYRTTNRTVFPLDPSSSESPAMPIATANVDAVTYPIKLVNAKGRNDG